MSSQVVFCFVASAIILTHSKIASVNGQCTTEGCGHDDVSMNIVTEIQQQIVQTSDQQNKQIQNIHDVLTASFQQVTTQFNAVMRSLQAVDRRLEEHDVYIKQGQSFHEILNASFEKMKSQHETVNRSFQAVDRRLWEQGQSIHELLNESFQEMKIQYDSVNLSLQSVDQRLQSYQIDIKNQTQQTWTLVNGICDSEYQVRDCSDIKARGHTANGVYEVCAGHPPSRVCTNAFCDMQATNRSTASLVFQRRIDGSVNFNRTWAEYRDGFGNPDGEFWLGNEMLYRLTSKRKYKLRVDLEDFNGAKRFAEYSNFSISSSADNYTLTVGNYSGNAGDSMNRNNGKQFSTIDADNDGWSGNSCASYNGGAWWYYSCSYAHLNGKYHQRHDTVQHERGIIWYHWKNSYTHSLKATEMKLVPVA